MDRDFKEIIKFALNALFLFLPSLIDDVVKWIKKKIKEREDKNNAE